jgi:poly(A) polymerase
MDQGSYHHLDVWSHTVEVVANTDSRDLALRLAALFHDVAKPICKREENGKTTFHGHDTEGERLTREIMARLKFSNDEIDVVALLVRHHMRFLGMKEFTDSAARRILRDLRDQTERLIELCEADSAAHAPGTKRPDFDHIRDVLVRVAEKTPIDKLESPIDGARIMQVTGLPEGERVGKVKRHLSDLVVEGKLLHTDFEAAEKEAQRFVGNRNNV